MRTPVALLAAATLSAATLVTPATHAFCGFYVGGADAQLFNNATQVVLMREGTRTVLSMQNNYQGPPSNFAMVVPVPVVLQKENVKTLPREIFARVDKLDAPRLVEYWEQDPCMPDVDEEDGMADKSAASPRKKGSKAESAKDDLGVTVEAQFVVGEYEIVILSAKDSSGLDTWLKREGYKIPAGSEPYLRAYVAAGSKFFVARVDASKVKFDKGMATLSPLRFHYDSPDFRLPVRLGLANANGPQDLIVHVLARGQRYDVANYPNVTIPTNFDVADTATSKFGTFYATLFDRTLVVNPKAVVTEYSWDAGSCDPCPSPALDGSELSTLGADVLTGGDADGVGGPRRRGKGWRGGSGFVLTRLHARYTKESLGEDLVFKAAPPIVGGREIRGEGGALEHGATPSSVNNFQGRYAIRHAWTGPIACANPRRGIWGGPPAGAPPPRPQAALDLAFVARESASLPSFVKEEVPEIGVKPGVPLPAAPAEPAATTPAAPPPAPKKGGCAGCATIPSTGASGAAAAAIGLGLAALWTRRRRVTSRDRRD
ncbi:MAG: DUF2330 domain-containing protein [Myxococcales bacterium]|nr:DUF2330 domain-containing protein [Myxococcales bacterium]